MLLLHLHRGPRMRVTVTFCRETQNQRRDNKSDDAFLFRSENDLVS
ncbi:MAG: hypothetical protein QOE73_1285 [Verrucomicrobiota bacterium]|jgi:hypothetical protein